jgi:hypothetical protein
MTQYDDKVQRQRDLLKAEEWSKTVKSVHAHSISSMFYDTRPQDTEDGKSVLDIQYNSGLVERKTHDGYTVYFGTALKGDELLYEYYRNV